MLSLAELGVGTSIVYSLYSPLAKGDKTMINSLMRLYKKIYTIIGVVVGVLGVLLVPVLPHIIGDAQDIPGIYIIYFLFLLNSVSSYFFTYNRSLLIADQKAYITVIFDFFCSVIVTILQIVSLYLFNNYFVYLSIQILGTIITNLVLTYNVKKLYPYLSNQVNSNHIDDKTKDTLKKNTIGNLSSKIGSVVVSGTDNIFISSFVGIGTVGLYSNYILIINSIRGLCGQITNSITSSIGNVGVDANDELSKRIFERHNFVNYTLTFFSSVILIVTINPFIVMWVGHKYELPSTTVFLILSNFIILMLRNSSIVFIDAFGLAWQQRWKSIVEALMNISLSFTFLLVFNLGINGVLLATTLSSLLTVCWIEPYVVYKYGLHSSIVNYIKIIIKQVISLIIALVVSHLLLVDRFSISFSGLILYGFTSFLIALITYLIFYLKSPEFIFLYGVLVNLVRKRLKK
jgi:O-antigen/teichoic acid export membrane protein